MSKKKENDKTIYIDNDLNYKAYHILKGKTSGYRIYSKDLKSLGKYDSTKKALSALRKIDKDRSIIVIHDYNGKIINISRPRVIGLSTSKTNHVDEYDEKREVKFLDTVYGK